jgi:voltage-gated sodium channel
VAGVEPRAGGILSAFPASCRTLVADRRFQAFVLALIVLNATLIGVETVPGIVARSPALFGALDVLVQALFVAEIAVRMAAHGRRVDTYFRDGWNVFDFCVVALSLLPVAGPFATVARLARILRVARVATTLPDLRLIIGTMLRSIPSLGHVVLLLGLLFYIYGVVGFHLFGATDPAHWGSLPTAARTLFQILTLEGWLEVEAASRAAHPLSWLFYSSYIVVAVFVVTNLFIAVVINNLETVRAEEAADLAGASGAEPTEEVRRRIVRLRAELDALERALETSRDRRPSGE